MKKVFKKSIVMLFIVSIFLCDVSYAAVFPDILKIFGIGIDESEKDSSDKKIEKEKSVNETETYTEEQKKIAKVIADFYDGMINVDIDRMMSNTNYNLSKSYLNDINNFYSEYPESLEDTKRILKSIDYKIISFSNAGDKVYVKIEYTYPTVKKLMEKVLPSILIKNAKDLFAGNISNKNLSSIMDILALEVQKNNYDKSKGTYELVFKKIDGEWKLTELFDIENKLRKYIDELGSNFLK